MHQLRIDEDLFFQDLAKVLKFHRKKAKLTQTALAELAGVGKTVIFDLEHKKTNVKLSTLKKILFVLNIRIFLSSPLLNNQEILNEKS